MNKGDALSEKFWLYVTVDACKALYNIKFRQIERNGRKLRHIELSNSVITVKFSKSVGRNHGKNG